MAYPTLPFAFVHRLASITQERASFATTDSQITLLAQNGINCRALRVQLPLGADTSPVNDTVARMFENHQVDTFALIYSTAEADPCDIGLILEFGKPDIAIEWRWRPSFQISLVQEANTIADLTQAPGISLARRLLQGQPSIA